MTLLSEAFQFEFNWKQVGQNSSRVSMARKYLSSVYQD